ncbi:MAG: hypothetical protein JXQ72_06765 [Anaerolineae bacterium]|nr:hypothetical protein [Anaerolineae bacterium]
MHKTDGKPEGKSPEIAGGNRRGLKTPAAHTKGPSTALSADLPTLTADG